jgi:hypothetical protein
MRRHDPEPQCLIPISSSGWSSDSSIEKIKSLTRYRKAVPVTSGIAATFLPFKERSNSCPAAGMCLTYRGRGSYFY